MTSHRSVSMQRRTFLTSSLTASALAVASPANTLRAAQEAAEKTGREFYELRQYHLVSGPQRKLCDDFFREALVPALNRIGIKPVGVFDLAIGPETPTVYILMPSLSLEALATAENRLAQDPEYM